MNIFMLEWNEGEILKKLDVSALNMYFWKFLSSWTKMKYDKWQILMRPREVMAKFWKNCVLVPKLFFRSFKFMLLSSYGCHNFYFLCLNQFFANFSQSISFVPTFSTSWEKGETPPAQSPYSNLVRKKCTKYSIEIPIKKIENFI